MPKPNLVTFLLQLNFSLLIFDAFVNISNKDWSKTTTSLFHEFCYQGTKTKPSYQTWITQYPTKINSFLQPNFAHLILDAFVTIPHQDCAKTTISLFHQFCNQVTKTGPCHQTWLSQNPSKINSICKQSFHRSFWIHWLQFPTKIAQNPRLHFFTNFGTKAQKLSQTTKLG